MESLAPSSVRFGSADAAAFPKQSAVALNRVQSLGYRLLLVALAGLIPLQSASSLAQESEADENVRDEDVRIGYVIDFPSPLDSAATNRVLDQLSRLNAIAPQDERLTVVLRFAPQSGVEATTATELDASFEDALKLARAMTGDPLRRLRIVSLVQREVSGHAVLPVVASDLLLVSNDGVVADASAGEQGFDETIRVAYESIAQRRGLFPPAVVSGLVDPSVEVAQVSMVGGEQKFAAGDDLEKLRESGDVLREELWSAPGVATRIDARKLRGARIASAIVDSDEDVGELLDLADLNPVDEIVVAGEAKGVTLEITGSIVGTRSRRWQSNLSSSLQSGDVNTWLINIDSGGGSLDESASLAGWFAEPDLPLRTVAGWVRGEARADAALVALACKPLYLAPEARLGGPGAYSITPDDLARYNELIDQIGFATKRPLALIRGLLDPNLVVYRYTHRKTGRIRYATEDVIASEELEVDDNDPAMSKWIRGEAIELSEGLTAGEAISLGLAEGQSDSLANVARSVGLSAVPPEIEDRGLIRFVERIGRSQLLGFLLVFIGFAALSAEANAPGLGIPGFIALLSFALWFWIQFLAGTAEWLELVVFGLGLVCIAIELFVVPGLGVFGIGGLALTVLGLVLMSQTFVIPRNAYQIRVLTQGVWIALGGAAGLVGGFALMRIMLPHVPIFRGLVMEPQNVEVLEQSERLGDYSALLGQAGTATTPLRPSGKARFGDEVVQVVSDGSMIDAGSPVRVSEVYATRVVVEPLENG